jgi:TolB-like protein/Tfp pilus assembly protein PilF
MNRGTKLTSTRMKNYGFTYRFGLYELDPRSGDLIREGTRIPLRDQPLQLLLLLLENAGELVSREDIRKRLWDSDVTVEFDNSLNTAVSRLREALDDSPTNPRFVATVPRRGYRFIAPVEKISRSADEEPAPSHHRIIGVAAVLLALIAAVAGVTLWTQSTDVTPDSSEALKLAVLPFENLNSDPTQDYLSDGLTEELIARLGALDPNRLGIIARTSVMRYKGTSTTVEQIGRDLNVQFVLEGTLRREGETAHITVRLIDVTTQAHLWTESYDRQIAGFVSLERDIARNVADALALKLLPADNLVALSDSAAYEYTLRGRHFLNQRSMEGFERALSAFQSALDIDPSYDRARMGLAMTYALMGEYDIRRPRDMYKKALDLSTIALEKRPTAESHLMLAYLSLAYDWDTRAGEEHLQKALSLNPSLVDAHMLLGGYYSTKGRHDEAVASLERALELDPLSSVVNADLSWRFFLAKRYGEAIEQARRTIELDPDFLPAHDNLKWALIMAGKGREACDAFLKVVELEGNSRESLVTLRQLCADDGVEGVLREALSAPEERVQRPQESPYDIAIDYATLGEIQPALDWLERAYEERETDMLSLGVDPRLDPLRSEPRFQVILDRLSTYDSSG